MIKMRLAKTLLKLELTFLSLKLFDDKVKGFIWSDNEELLEDIFKELVYLVFF